MSTSPATVSRVCPVFHPAMLAQDMTLDTAFRWGSLFVIVAALVVGASLQGAAQQLPHALALAAIVAWVMVSMSSTRVWRSMPQITALMDHDPVSAEAQLALALRKKLLHRPVRLLLYHRLAVLRHRQQRFAETAAICHSVLQYDLGTAATVKPHLLLMLTESQLLCGDLHGAYHSLLQLSQTPLNLVEATQRLALQKRYEIAAGYFDKALETLDRTLAMAELMPPTQCGAMHAMLAFAARQTQQATLAQWLQQRAELLCTAEELAGLAGGAVVMGTR